MLKIFRIFEIRNDFLFELAFVANEEIAKEYLESCNRHNKDKNVSYFAEEIKVEQ